MPRAAQNIPKNLDPIERFASEPHCSTTDAETAGCYGHLKAKLKAAGFRIPDDDLRFYAISKQHSSTSLSATINIWLVFSSDLLQWVIW